MAVERCNIAEWRGWRQWQQVHGVAGGPSDDALVDGHPRRAWPGLGLLGIIRWSKRSPVLPVARLLQPKKEGADAYASAPLVLAP